MDEACAPRFALRIEGAIEPLLFLTRSRGFSCAFCSRARHGAVASVPALTLCEFVGPYQSDGFEYDIAELT